MDKKKTTLAGGVVARVLKGKVHIALFRWSRDQNWLLPKGHVEEGETLEQAALREVAEEIGLTNVRIVKLLGVKERASFDGKEGKTIYYFLMKAEGEDFQKDPKVTWEVVWFPLDELPDFFWPDQKALILEHFHQILLEFEEAGSSEYRIDYRRLKTAAIVTAFVRQARTKKILLLQRSDHVSTYTGLWNTVAGYLDDEGFPEEKARAELNEELGISQTRLRLIKVGSIFEVQDPALHKTWIVHPFLFETDQEQVHLDREHVAYRWITPEELKEYPVVPQLEESLRRVSEGPEL